MFETTTLFNCDNRKEEIGKDMTDHKDCSFDETHSMAAQRSKKL